MKSRRDPRLKTLATMDVLSGMPLRQLNEIGGLTTEVNFAPGHVLCRQGAVAQEVLMISDGDVAISRDGVPIGVLGAGSMFGEMGLVAGAPRNATVTALTEVRALVLSRGEFSQLLHAFPLVSDNVRALAARRSQELAALDAA